LHLIKQRYIDIQKPFHFPHPPVFFKFRAKVFAFPYIFLQVLSFFCRAAQLSGGRAVRGWSHSGPGSGVGLACCQHPVANLFQLKRSEAQRIAFTASRTRRTLDNISEYKYKYHESKSKITQSN